MHCSPPGFAVLHHLPEFAQTHVHGSVTPSNHLILCRPLLLLPSVFPSIRVFSNESALCIRWRKYWLQHQCFQWIFSWFLLGWLFWCPCCPRDFQESSPAPQFKSINSSVLSLRYAPTLTSICNYQKNHTFDCMSNTVLTIREVHQNILIKQQVDVKQKCWQRDDSPLRPDGDRQQEISSHSWEQHTM